MQDILPEITRRAVGYVRERAKEEQPFFLYFALTSPHEPVVPSKELLARIRERWALSPVNSNYRGEVAKRYVFDDGQGEIGFISSVSEPFCGDCHRARLSADGTVYTCLFASGGANLRTALRAGASDADLVGLLQNVWRNRTDRYSEIRGRLLEHQPDGVEKPSRVEVYRMGG